MIPLIDLKAQYQSIKEEIDVAVQRVLDSSQYVLGREVDAFERDFAEYCRTKHAIAVNSGTSALHLALLAAGVGPGDEVITVPFTFVATVAAIVYAGARPVFVDIEPRSFTIDVSQIEKALTGRTKVILPVHLYGQAADMDAIAGIASRYGLRVIEDAAQAHGAEYKGRRVGGLGDMGCFSFYPAKNLGAYGEGGAITTNDSAYAQIIKALRDWGQERRYHHSLKGYNYRMDALQGAILGVKLRHLEEWNDARREHAQDYERLLSHSDILRPSIMPSNSHVWHIYAVRSKQRDHLQRVLQDRGIQTGIHYPIPVHLQEAYADLGYRLGDFPFSEQVAREILSLPMFPDLDKKALREIAASVNGSHLRESR